MNKTLSIYKASAGSGKTFRLAVEYIKLVISDPSSYRHILAVTFTNKATEEMKMRILSHLYGIAHHLDESKDYLNRIVEELGVSERFAVERAQQALTNLIHNYHYFRVETIDTFFQSVLRNLARELELPANLRIELNDGQIEEQAVDQLIEGLSRTDRVLSWILDYIGENMSDDKTWNIFRQVKNFGLNIFKDVYKTSRSELQRTLGKADFFGQYTKTLRKIKNDAQSKLEASADAFFDLLSSEGFTVNDLASGTSGAAGYFVKLHKGEYSEKELLKTKVLNAMSDPMTWLRKDDQKSGNPLADLAPRLTQLLIETEKSRVAQSKLYKSADLTLRHLNQLRLLGSIERKVNELNNEANRFLLSDTQILLNTLISDSDSPFIFEKIGSQLKHIMIDEFQDTSLTQWHNFKVLLKECMSHADSSSLIVGDVKQSIYRWRSGDWRLLNNIEQEFAWSEQQLETKTLKENYRSERHVIDFNNAFFQTAAQIDYEEQNKLFPEGARQLQKAYQPEEVVQKIPSERGSHGFVSIDLIPKEDYQATMIGKVCDAVLSLLASGISGSKIAILVRSNQTIREIADFFMQNYPDIRLVSDEAFCLDSSLAVNMIINAMRVLTHPEDQLALANIVKAYQKQVKRQNYIEGEQVFQGAEISKLLPPAFMNHLDQLAMLPVSELVEKLCTIFELTKLSEQSAYIYKLFDVISDYLQDHSPDLDSFLADWDENLHLKAIQSDEIEGIRLITIHKSKGLEFDHVIIPYCDWKLEKAVTLWCRPSEKPFSELPLVPISFNEKQMMGSIYEHDYLEEHLQNMVDNLNLLYVAFTRASKTLLVFARRGQRGSRSYLIEQALRDVHKALPRSTLEGDLTNSKETVRFTYGSMDPSAAKAQATSRNVISSQPSPVSVNMENFEKTVEFRQSNKSREFVDKTDDTEQQDYIQTGNVLHHILSTIRTESDIEPAIRQLEFDGILHNKRMSQTKIREMLQKRLADPRVKEWFAPKWRLFNECSILHIDPNTHQVVGHRPDRVMTDGQEWIVVDYKFGHPRPEYHDQVAQYMHLLNQMGHQHVRGYLWFVYANRIEEVKS